MLEDEDINESISTPEMGAWEGIIEVLPMQICCTGFLHRLPAHKRLDVRWSRQVICQTEFKTQIAYRVRGPVTYGEITALVRRAAVSSCSAASLRRFLRCLCLPSISPSPRLFDFLQCHKFRVCVNSVRFEAILAIQRSSLCGWKLSIIFGLFSGQVWGQWA